MKRFWTKEGAITEAEGSSRDAQLAGRQPIYLVAEAVDGPKQVFRVLTPQQYRKANVFPAIGYWGPYGWVDTIGIATEQLEQWIGGLRRW